MMVMMMVMMIVTIVMQYWNNQLSSINIDSHACMSVPLKEVALSIYLSNYCSMRGKSIKPLVGS